MKKRLRGKRKNGENNDLIVKKNLIWMKELSCKFLRYATVFSIVAATSFSLCGCDEADMEAYYDMLDDLDEDSGDIDLSDILDNKDVSPEDLDELNDLLDKYNESKDETSDEGTDESTDWATDDEQNVLGDRREDDSNSDADSSKDADQNSGCKKKKSSDKSSNKNNDCDKNKENDQDASSDKDKANDQCTDQSTDQSTECNKDKEKDQNNDCNKEENKESDQDTDGDKKKEDDQKSDSDKDTDAAQNTDSEKTADDAGATESTEKPEEPKKPDSEPNNNEALPDDGRQKMDQGYESSYRGFSDANAIKVREAAGLTDESIAELKKQQEGYYAYSRLSEGGKTLYVELLQIINKEADGVFVSTNNPDAIQLAFDYLMMDHPEIFWVNGYRYVKHFTYNGGIDKLAFTGVYTYDLNEVANRQAKINEYVDKCLAGAPSTEDEYYAIKYVYDYLIANTEYDLRAPDNQNICSVFIGRKTVCSGYARATQYLLNKLGIKCTYVTGYADNGQGGGNHAWNLVRCNGAYYYMDTTWGDTGMTSADGKPRINYDYLLLTKEAMGINHNLSDRIDYPECNNTKDNYYVRENLYLDSADMGRVKEVFDKRYAEGGDNATIRCASKDIYNSLYQQLIKDGAIFGYLQGDKRFSYTLYEDTNTIAIWIK
ncbi:MAG: transglutaminase domain-containing protein [Butyrivibrio sp.]|nr:transglutaminase domain-containing protein [Butyrivibrio sp.]